MSASSPEPRVFQQAFVDPLFPALTVGAVAGVTGLIGGGFGALVFSQHPVLFATAAGLQCFGLGSTFWYVRNLSAQAPPNGNVPNRESVLRSTFAGSMAGAVNGAFRSRSNVLPGAFMFGIFGMMGQATYNSLRSSGEELETQPPYIQRLLNSRWVPLKHLSDEEYVGMLNEKTVRIDAEIAILDERITVLEKSKATGG